jgi:hypothetical protein
LPVAGMTLRRCQVPSAEPGKLVRVTRGGPQ